MKLKKSMLFIHLQSWGLPQLLPVAVLLFLLGGGPVEMALAFIAAGIGNLIRTKLIKHHYTLFLNIAVSVSAACFTYAVFLKLAELVFHIPEFHEAGYICSMLFIIPGFPFITSGIDLANWICVRDWSGLLMQSLSLWLPLYLHGSWLYFCIWNRPILRHCI